MSTHEATAAGTAPIPLSALVVGADVDGSQVELIRDLRAVAMTAASDWARASSMATPNEDPNGFGQKVAQVYLATLRELNAGFEPGAECPAGRI